MSLDWSLSIVIPAYNREKHLAVALNSAIGQTVPADEIIVVNDGSTDGTECVAKSFAPHVRVISIKNNGAGPGRPRNVGIAHCLSRYIMFLDSDDYLEPHAVERHRDAFRLNVGAGIVCSNYYVQEKRDGQYLDRTLNDAYVVRDIAPRIQVGDRTFAISAFDAYRRYCRDNYLRFAATVARSACVEVGGFDETLPQSQDMAFFFRVIANHDLLYIDEPLHTYVHHTQNISHANTGMRYRDYVTINQIRALEKELTFCADRESCDLLVHRITNVIADLAHGYGATNYPVQAIRTYVQYVRRGGELRVAVRGCLAAAEKWLLSPTHWFSSATTKRR